MNKDLRHADNPQIEQEYEITTDSLLRSVSWKRKFRIVVGLNTNQLLFHETSQKESFNALVAVQGKMCKVHA